jgi:hypothetical protein
MRPVTVAVLVVASSLLSTSAALAERTSKTKKKNGAVKPAATLVASTEPLPPLPAPTVATSVALAPVPDAAPAAKDRPATSASATDRPSAGAGFFLVGGTGLSVLGGSIGEGVGVGAALMTVELKLGGYITQHFGVLGGVKGGYGALTAGCAGTCSNAVSYQFPVLAQYAFQDRTRGFYVEGGLALVTTYAGSTDSKKDPNQGPEVITMSAPVDLELGVGYRIPSAAKPEKAATGGLDLHVTLDIGQFKSLEYKARGVDVSGDIARDQQALHVAVGLGVGYVFAP